MASTLKKRAHPEVIVYQDLVNFDASQDTPQNTALLESIGRAFGASEKSLGILAVEGVPEFASKRQALLKEAYHLAHLSPTALQACERPDALFSVGWSHGREFLNGKPDTAKGSFYANPWTNSLIKHLTQQYPEKMDYWKQEAAAKPECYADNVWPEDLPSLEKYFMELGQIMGNTGILVAAVCDAYCRKHNVELGLQQTLQRSRNSKGRLLHYFAKDAPAPSDEKKQDADDESDSFDSWCGWHNDHGSLTALAPGLFLDPQGNPVDNPDPDYAGLYIQARNGEIYHVALPSTACGFQIGETSQIQSGGVLQATPHAVQPPRSSDEPSNEVTLGVTRESFAVFLEPDFDDSLAIPDGKSVQDCQAADTKLPPSVVPLAKRWKAGQTFGDFHFATVSQFTTED